MEPFNAIRESMKNCCNVSGKAKRITLKHLNALQCPDEPRKPAWVCVRADMAVTVPVQNYISIVSCINCERICSVLTYFFFLLGRVRTYIQHKPDRMSLWPHHEITYFTANSWSHLKQWHNSQIRPRIHRNYTHIPSWHRGAYLAVIFE